jgi:hypothetical protein
MRSCARRLRSWPNESRPGANGCPPGRDASMPRSSISTALASPALSTRASSVRREDPPATRPAKAGIETGAPQRCDAGWTQSRSAGNAYARAANRPVLSQASSGNVSGLPPSKHRSLLHATQASCSTNPRPQMGLRFCCDHPRLGSSLFISHCSLRISHA